MAAPRLREACDQLGDGSDHDARLALGRRLDLQRLEARREIDAELGGGGLGQRLRARLDDVGQRGEARGVEAKIRGDHCGQGQLQGLQAAVDLARHERLAVGDVDLAGERRLAAAEQCSEHLAGLVGVVVDGLLAEEDQVRAFGLGDGGQSLGDAEGFGRAVVDDEDGAVGAHREGLAQGVFGLGGTDRHDDDLGGDTGFSLRRTASSTAISSKGFIAILTLSSSTPERSAFTRTRKFGSMTRLTATRTFTP